MNVIKKETSVSRGYDMRAQPRRRPKEENEQPLFLKKAFSMIDTCPPELGGWSEKGDTFIVKDVKIFSEQIIPTVFKHNNFSSFVRQLNFYGFRKIKSELYSHNAQWWEFRHPHFMRGQPELLCEIKRAVHYAASPQDPNTNMHEMDALKTQVAGISGRVADIDSSITGLSQLVGNLIMQANKRGQDGAAADSYAKKRRRQPLSPFVTAPSSSLSTRGASGLQEVHYSSGSDDASYDDFSESYSVSSDEHVTVSNTIDLPLGSKMKDIELLNSDFFRMSSGELLDNDPSIEFDDFLGLVPPDVLAAEAKMKTVKKEPYSSSAVPSPASLMALEVTVTTAPTATSLANSDVGDIPDILQHFSLEMQERFVDRLAESVGSHFALLLATTIVPATPAAIIPAAPAMSMNNYSTTFLQQSQKHQDQNQFWPLPLQQEIAVNGTGGGYNSYGKITPAMALPLASAALCSLIAAHCSGGNANSATCLAITKTTAAAGIICQNGICTNGYSQSANV